MSDRFSQGDAEEGAVLIRDIKAFAVRFVVLPPHASLPFALWIIATHLFDAFEVFPYLALVSPEKGCGKTRTAGVIELLANDSQYAICPSEAVLFRLIESKRPTLILDEAEVLTARGERADAIRAILNAGNRANAAVPRCVGQNFDIEFFHVYCPKVVCSIRVLPDTIRDRAIVIPMRRMRRDENVAKLIKRRVQPEADHLKARIVQWCEQNRAEVEQVYEVLDLDFLSDRDLENFEPLCSLLTVADPSRFDELQSAALALTCSKIDGDEDDSLSLRLLADIRAVWANGEGHLLSSTLMARLRALAESPWQSEEELDQRKLARMLKPYGATTRTVRAQDGRGSGYVRAQLEDAFSRYLRPET